MSGTLCEKHFSPVIEDGLGEPEILTIWPMSPCVICGECPLPYHEAMKAGRRWYAVRDSTIERARKHG